MPKGEFWRPFGGQGESRVISWKFFKGFVFFASVFFFKNLGPLSLIKFCLRVGLCIGDLFFGDFSMSNLTTTGVLLLDSTF